MKNNTQNSRIASITEKTLIVSIDVVTVYTYGATVTITAHFIIGA